VVIVIALTTIDNCSVAVIAGADESATEIVKVDVPVAVGVPEITPVAAFRVRPAGRVPAEIDHVYGIEPPVAARVWLYATPTVAEGSEAVVMLT
jgi:hypothetical protein